MKQKLLILAGCLALSACGGSSNNDSSSIASSNNTLSNGETSTPQVPVNTPPTLSGIFTIDAKAKSQYDLVLNAQDKENDPLSISIENQPDWLSYTVENNQVKLSVSPDFLDIETHTYPISVSDGKASTSYELTVNVLDNPQAWTPIDISAAELAGVWENKQQNFSITFNQQQQGLLIENGELSRFEYNGDSINKLWIYEHGCVYDCRVKHFRELQVIAKTYDKVYLSFKNTRNEEQTYMLRKPSSIKSGIKYSAALDENLYSDTYADLYADIINLNSDNQQLATLQTRTHNPPNMGSSYTDNDEYTFHQLNGLYDQASGVFTPSKKKVFYHTSLFEATGDQFVAFTVNYDKIQVLGKTQNHLIIQSRYAYQLDIQSVNVDPYSQDYAALTEFLRPKTDLMAFPVNKLTKHVTSLEAGKTYVGRIAPYKLNWTLGEIRYSGALEFTISNDNTGSVLLETADKSIKEVRTFTYVQNESELSITFGEKTYKYSLYSLPSGIVFMSALLPDEDSGKVYERTAYAHYEVDTTFTFDDYLGTYKHLPHGHSVMYLATDKIDLFYKLDDPLRKGDVFKVENNGSISYVIHEDCPQVNNNDFAACLASSTAKHSFPRARNIKLLTVENNIYTFKYSTMYIDNDGQKIAHESTWVFEKLD
ncbi:hypothetical protein [Pseudoalteromonas sp. MMG005]|uniref:hypothetical protein n=1 Tax=Pseudoalteromonas sp. MMG005 TaxID=2822682 RepID=UPI001B39D5A6|nr:hypothetical protein [Pseudoalteromonas sp. MMG005]MBQ4847444.1 hypothetical protein [Pseudoalteromonas sp. MMG005]